MKHQAQYKPRKNDPVILEMLIGNELRRMKTTYSAAVRMVSRTTNRGWAINLDKG